MSQSGYTPISLYYSSTASAVPTAGNLVAGELALNNLDGKLFYKDSSNVVQVIGTKGGVGTSSTTQVLYNNAGLIAGSSNMTFNGTTLTLANDASISGLTVGKGGGGATNNTAIGLNALPNTNTGTNNTAVGSTTMAVNTVTGAQNTTVGVISQRNLSSGASNSSLGYATLYTNTTGAQNTAIGDSALYSNTTANNNTAVGYQAAYANTTGTGITAVGYTALAANTTGTYNTAVGNGSLGLTNTGARNSAFGYSSLQANTGGNYNAAFGMSSLAANTTGASNVAVGTDALQANTTASYNTAVGYQAGYSNTTGTGAAYFGYFAGKASTGDYNTCLGTYAKAVNAGGVNNTLVGAAAGYYLSGDGNTFVGARNATGGTGCGELMTTGSKNTILGAYSGNQGGLDIRTASNYIVLSDGDGNPRGIFDNNGTYFVGNASAPSGTYNNIALSPAALAGGQNLSSSRNSTGNSQHVTFFNPNGQVGGINTLTSTTIYGTSSDYRLKENIAPMQGALAKVSLLKPCTYTWKIDGTVGEGFIAHELQQVVEGCVIGEKDAIDSEGKPVYQNIDTSFLVATLTAAIQEQQALIENLTTRLNALEGK